MRACSHLILPIMNHRKGPNTPISHHYPPFLAPPPPQTAILKSLPLSLWTEGCYCSFSMSCCASIFTLSGIELQSIKGCFSQQ